MPVAEGLDSVEIAAIDEAAKLAEEVHSRASAALEKLQQTYRSGNPMTRVASATMQGVENRLRNLMEEAEQLASYGSTKS